MQIADISNPQDRKKLIWALALGIVAVLFLWWTFIGFGGGSQPTSSRNPERQPPVPGSRASVNQAVAPKEGELQTSVWELSPVPDVRIPPVVAEAKRNIFAYQEKPIVAAGSSVPPPTPTPTPPVLLAAISPSNVYARTDDFTIEVTGDKFAPGIRIAIDSQDLQTRFVSPQQLSATVPASIIANPGTRQVTVRSTDGKLYSNAALLNVSPPPTPNYNYVGIILPPRRPGTAILQDKGSKEILNVQRGDVLGGRFRLTSISEKELVFVDTNLKIKHTLPFSTDRDRGFGPQSRPTPRVDSEDDEP